MENATNLVINLDLLQSERTKLIETYERIAAAADETALRARALAAELEDSAGWSRRATPLGW